MAFLYELYWRAKTKVQEILDKIPGPPDIFFNKSFKERLEKETKQREQENEKDDIELPDDFNDLKVEKDIYKYDLKLTNVRPADWKILGRNMLNLAYEDPMYRSTYDNEDEEDEEGTDKEDPLPPPPEPTEYVKAQKYPIISVKLKGLDWEALEEVGHLFYDCADYIEMGENGKPIPAPPTDGTIPEEVEAWKKSMMDPYQVVEDERTVQKTLTNADFIPGAKSKPYQDDHQDWIELCEQELQDPDNRETTMYEL